MRFLFIIALSVLFIGSCATSEIFQEPEDQKLVMIPVNFSELPDWNDENYKDFATAFLRSCEPIQKRTSNFQEGPEWGDIQKWQNLCQQFQDLEVSQYKSFFENSFVPHAISNHSDETGLFTGYYEASLNGSLERHGPYQYALRALPDDLVMVDLGAFRDELKGQRIAGRVSDGRLRPYETRAEIEAGRLPSEQDKILVWVDDAVDAFFVQIQGSGVVQMDDGSVMRIGYAGQNGHVYYAIGRELIERGEIEKENVSMQSIRAWLSENPDQAEEVMNTNKSYVFFRELDGQGPIGGQGVALTPTRSLAIDHSLIPYGVPLWIDIEYPKPGYQNIRRLMVAQDTGGAIRGPVRGDFFWGYGDFAEKRAGVMKSQGRYWVLLPK
ncbi:MAG: MltA domain-containing protein [Pseudomonadota bacterium]